MSHLWLKFNTGKNRNFTSFWSAVRLGGRKFGWRSKCRKFHRGGNRFIQLDITPHLSERESTENQIESLGIQVILDLSLAQTSQNPKGIWYTPVTGILATVWVESVPSTYWNQSTRNWFGTSLRLNNSPKRIIGNTVRDELYKSLLKTAERSYSSTGAQFPIRNPSSFSDPSLVLRKPFFFRCNVKLLQGKKVIDEITSYAAYREYRVMAKATVSAMFFWMERHFSIGPLGSRLVAWGFIQLAPNDEALAFWHLKNQEMGSIWFASMWK